MRYERKSIKDNRGLISTDLIQFRLIPQCRSSLQIDFFHHFYVFSTKNVFLYPFKRYSPFFINMKAMKFPFRLILLLLIPVFVFAQNSDEAWIRANYSKIERTIPMRDGVNLFTSIYIPEDTNEKHPILLTRTPYSCKPYGDEFKDYWVSYKMAYFREHYIVVTQDVRGRWMSEGQYENVRPFNPDKKRKETDEASDTWDTIEWLLKNIEDHNGKVGVFGVSYPGFYSTMAAASNHPALVAVSPQAPVTNWFIGDDFHHNGAFFLMDAFSFYVGNGFGQPHPEPTKEAAQKFEYPTRDNYKFYLEAGPLHNLAKLAGDDIRFWRDLYAHPDYDAWWKARDARNATKNLEPAMLWVGGHFDAEDNWGAWNSYRAAEENNPGKAFNKLVMGPWYHGQWSTDDGTHLGNIQFGSNTSTWYQEHIEIPFFNHFLKGKGDISALPEATIFVTGQNEWRNFSQWPPEEANNRELYFHANGLLDSAAPVGNQEFSEYRSDPANPVPYTEDIHFKRTREYMTDDQRFAERRPDVLAFKTEILSQDITVTGNVVADLLTSISTTDADFVVKIIDVFPDSLSINGQDEDDPDETARDYPMGGYEMLVHGEVFRGRYRNSFENPEAFEPDKVTQVRFKVGDIAHTFKKGHRIMVQIQSSWFPLVDRNPQQFVDIYHCSESDFIISDIRIFHDRENPSRIILPVLE